VTSTWRLPAGVFLFYCLVTVPMVWPVFNFGAVGSACYFGDVRFIIWTLAWNNHVLLSGLPAYFDANIFYPTPGTLALNEHHFGIALFTLPVFVLTRNPTLGYNLVWLASFPLAALAAYRLAAEVVDDRRAAIVAGLVYAFSFFRFLHLGHVHYLWTFWLPWSLLLLSRWVATGRARTLVLWTAVVLLQALSSWYLAVLTLLANALLLGWCLVRALPARAGETRARPAERPWKPAVALVGSVGVMAAILWTFARPYLGRTGDQREALLYSADAFGYLVPPASTLMGHWLAAGQLAEPRWSFGESTTFLGYTALALALIGVAGLAWRNQRGDRDQRGALAFYLVLGVTSLLLSLGPSRAVAANADDWSLYGLFAQMPGLNLFRAPARFALLVTLSLALLAAGGTRLLLLGRGRAAGWLLAAVLGALTLVESFPAHYELDPPAPAPVPSVYRYLARLEPGPVVSLPTWVDTPLPAFEADYQLFSTAHWFPIVNGFSRVSPPGHEDTMRRLSTFPSPGSADLLRRLGVRYVVLHANRYNRDFRVTAQQSRSSADFTLLAKAGDDYLWRVRP
jgi:hypothetical protein